MVKRGHALVCVVSICVLTSAVCVAAVPDRIPGELVGAVTPLRGNVHHKALPKFDQGQVDPGMRMDTMTVVMTPTAAQRKALATLIAEQQDPHSANYHKWLTPEQWADRFGLSQTDIQKVVVWLKSQGFRNVRAARGRNWVSFEGTAGQVQNAFRTEIHHYQVDGQVHYANATEPSVPTALAGVAVGVRGLHDFRPRPLGIRRNTVAQPRYNSSSFGALVAPGDIATIYDIDSLYSAGIDGSGQKLAVMGQTDIYLADITDFRTGFGLSSISCTTNASGVITSCNDPHFQYVLNGQDPGLSTNGDIGEADLDIEWSGAVARGAQIIYVNSTDTFTSYYYAIDNAVAPVISLSYGLCEFDDQQFLSGDETELQKANSEGITFVNSSGDTGAAECETSQTITSTNLATQGLGVSYPASSPEVTGTGGSAIPLANFGSNYWQASNRSDGGSALSYVPEQVWNDDAEIAEFCAQNASNSFCTQGGSTPVSGWVPITSAATAQTDIGMSSSGGGPSNCSVQNTNFTACVSGFPQPAWQTVSISGQASVRFSPDISFLATPNFPGYIFCTPLSELGMSGTTSSCSPGGATGITNALNLSSPSIIGGTSASTPIFAGMIALLNQSVGSAPGSGLGNVNSKLYTFAAVSGNGVFNQITTGDNIVSCQPGTPAAQPAALQCPASGKIGFLASNADTATGYNLVAGLGSVNAAHLVSAWASTLSSGFTLTPTAASYQVTQGQPLDATVTVQMNGGFSGTISFTCTDPAPESVCTAPSPVNATGAVSFHITTTAATGRLQPPFDRTSGIFYALCFPGLLGIVVMAGSRKRSSTNMRLLSMVFVLGVSSLWLASCGGSKSPSSRDQGTVRGQYTINVTGTSGSTTSNASFTLNVQ